MTTNAAVTSCLRRSASGLSRWSRGTTSHNDRCNQARTGPPPSTSGDSTAQAQASAAAGAEGSGGVLGRTAGRREPSRCDHATGCGCRRRIRCGCRTGRSGRRHAGRRYRRVASGCVLRHRSRPARRGRLSAGTSTTRPPGTVIRSPGASSASTGWRGAVDLVVVGLMPAARVSVADVADLLVGHQRDDGARGAGARRTAGAVQVGLVLDRRVGVDDQRDVVDVDAAGRDVGGDQGRGLAGVERVQVAGAGVLAEVAVQLDGRARRCVELAGQRLGAVLGAGEDDGAAGRAGQVDQDRRAGARGATCRTWWSMRRDRRLRRVGLVGDRRVAGTA